MTPWLGTAGRAWFAATAAIAVVGALAKMPLVVVTAEVFAACLAAAYLLAVRRGNALESDAVRATLTPRLERNRWTRGERVELEVRVANRSGVTLPNLVARLPETSGLAWDEDTVALGDVPGGTEVTVEIGATVRRAGRWSLHGVELASEDALSLSRVSVWVGVDATVVCRPRSDVRALRSSLRERPRARLPAGAHAANRPGDGYDLRRIREHVPGDDVRRIAWKATARRGKLMVRQHEDEVVASAVLLVEAGGSLRGGDGGAKQEFVIDLAATAVAASAAQRDRLGIASFDDALIGALPARDGSVHYEHLMEHAILLAHAYAPGTTDTGDAGVTRAVIEHLVLRERVDFRRQRTSRPADEFAPLDERFHLEAFERWAALRFAGELSRMERAWTAAGFDPASWAFSRRLAAAIGLELPPRTGAWAARRAASWADVFARVPAMTRQTSSVVLVSDLESLGDPRALRDAVVTLRAARHRPVVVSVDTASFVGPHPEPEDPVPAEVHRLYTARAVAERDRLEEALRSIGLPVLRAAAGDDPGDVWLRALAVAAAR